MPVKPDSRFSALPVLRAVAADGSVRQVVALRLIRRQDEDGIERHRVRQGEAIDLLANLFYGSDRLWWRILDANPLVYPLDIEPGDVLNIPSAVTATRVTRARRF